MPQNICISFLEIFCWKKSSGELSISARTASIVFMWYIYVDNIIQVGLYPIRLPDLDHIGFLLTILSETTKGRYSTQKNTLLANQTDIGSVSTSESTTRDSTSQAMDIQTSTSPGKGYRAYLWQHIFHKWAIKQTVYAFRRSSLMQFKFLYIWFVLVLWSHSILSNINRTDSRAISQFFWFISTWFEGVCMHHMRPKRTILQQKPIWSWAL